MAQKPRHAANGTGNVAVLTGNDKVMRRPGMTRRRKPVVVNNSEPRAVVYRDKEIVISKRFRDVVQSIYTGANVAAACEGNAERLLDVMVARLRKRNDLPTWDRRDIATAIGHLSDRGDIWLPVKIREG